MSDRKAINIIFTILVAFGLISCFLFSLNLDLDSDTVVPGLVTMEIIEHGNFQFTYPVDDPYLFTDIFTFHFVPQALSGYDPTVLRLTAFAVFVMVVAVFAYLVYRFSSLTSALIFAALFTNMQPGAFYLYLSPEYHVGTLLFTGLFLVAFHTDMVKKLPFYVVLAISFVVGLIIISDSMLIATFVLPYLGYCLYRLHLQKEPVDPEGNKKERAKQASVRKAETSKIYPVLILLGSTTLAAYVLKMNNFFLDLHLFFITNKSPTMAGVDDNLARFVNSLLQLVSNNLYNLVNKGISWYDAIIAAVFILVVAYSLVRMNKKAEYLNVIFLLSALAVFIAFVFTTLGEGGSGRFLIFIALSIFAIIGIAYKPEKPGLNVNTAFLGAVVILILAAAASNIIQISGYDYQPNKEDYALISYLEENNLTYGYSDINTANKLIYLSKEKVLYPKVQIVDDNFKIDFMLTTTRWYNKFTETGQLCLIVNPKDMYYNETVHMATIHVPDKTYNYEGYTIYYYNKV